MSRVLGKYRKLHWKWLMSRGHESAINTYARMRQVVYEEMTAEERRERHQIITELVEILRHLNNGGQS